MSYIYINFDFLETWMTPVKDVWSYVFLHTNVMEKTNPGSSVLQILQSDVTF